MLGFSPITIDNINSIINQNTNLHESDAYLIAIKEFLQGEMKIPIDVIESFKICRVFPPATKPMGWQKLYAEFENTSQTDLILNFAKFLRPGNQVSIYVPGRLQPRFSAVNTLAHEYRKGPVPHKTRVKYGISDFVLLVKPKSHPHL